MLYVWKKRVVAVESLDIEDLIQLSDDMCDENAHDPRRFDPPAQTRYSDEEIAAEVRQAESGVPIAEIVRKLRISEATFSVWVKRIKGFQTSEICELREENAQLRQLAVDLALNGTVCKTNETEGHTLPNPVSTAIADARLFVPEGPPLTPRTE